MASSVITLSVTDVNESRRSRTRTVKVAVAASPGTYPAGGWTIDLTSVLNPNNLPEAKFTRIPVGYAIKNSYGTLIPVFTQGTTLANSKLQLFATGASSGAVLAEFADATATPASVSGVPLYIDFIGPKNL